MISSFRLRLTAWYLAFFSLLFVLLGIFLYGVLWRGLQARLDETLSSQANTGASLFEDELQEMNGDRLKAAREAVSEMRLGASTVAIFSPTRMLAASSAVAPDELKSIVARAAAAPGADLALTLPRLGRQDARVAAHRMMVGSEIYVVVAVEPLDTVVSSLQVVRRALFFALPLLMAVAGLGGYLVASHSLAPLQWMAEQARRISGNNLQTRLDIGDAAKELATLAAAFNELLARLDQSFESMRRFVADASHELRTPLSVIRGEADVALAQERSPAEYRQSLAIILDESRRLSRLVEDLLNLARADAGRVKLDVREFYFNDLLGDCCRSVQAQAAARSIAFEYQAPGDIPFHGDEGLLRRLVVNLLDNAIRYTPPGGRVSASLESEGPDLRMRIANTASIPPEAAAHLFERFYRADKARSREDGGFGLGLSIVKWIAESHHGAVELDSRPREGTTFTVTLPR